MRFLFVTADTVLVVSGSGGNWVPTILADLTTCHHELIAVVLVISKSCISLTDLNLTRIIDLPLKEDRDQTVALLSLEVEQ